MKDEIQRNSDGTFPPGQSGNPAGGNGNETGFQKAGPRIRHFLEKPAEEIIALTQDPAALKKLPMRDYLIIMSMAGAAQQTKEGRMNRQELFDRAYGNATQVLGNDVENPFIAPMPDRFVSVEEAAAFYLKEVQRRPA